MSEKVECDCWRGHVDDCPNFDAVQGYWNLKAELQSLEKLLNDGFTVEKIERRGDETDFGYWMEIKHPTQTEEFDGWNVMAMLKQFHDWVMECAVME